MCHGNVLIYTCRHRQVSEIQMCARARKPANHHGCWTAFRFWLTGKDPRRPCGAPTAQRQHMGYPCDACANLPLRRPQPSLQQQTHVDWDRAFIPTRTAPRPPQPSLPPLPPSLPARPQRAVVAPALSPSPAAWLRYGPDSVTQWRQGPSAYAPMSFEERMTARQQRQREREQTQQTQQTQEQIPLLTLPAPPPRSQYRDMAATRPPTRKLQKRSRPPTLSSPKADKTPPQSLSKTRAKARALRKNLQINTAKANGLSQGSRAHHGIFCLGAPPESEESMVCIDAKRIEQQGRRR